jgi:hypothetical protein
MPHGTSHSIQQFDERLLAKAFRHDLRKLAYGEVRLLLAGARPTEGYATDPRYRQAVTGTVRPAAHLTRS